MAELSFKKNRIEQRTKKRVFLGLLLGSLLFLFSLTMYLFFLAVNPLSLLTRGTIVFIAVVIILLLVVFLGGLLVMLVMIIGKRNILKLSWLVDKTIFVLYPMALQAGRFFHVAQDMIERSFIEVNNQLVLARAIKVPAGNILILLPHCLQDDSCTYKITHDVDNCRRCKKCQISAILELASAREIRVVVVTGGTMARQKLEKYRPGAVIAVACERDLCSGVLDSFPLPVTGVVNERPYGPCFNTRVNIKNLEKALDLYLLKTTEMQTSIKESIINQGGRS